MSDIVSIVSNSNAEDGNTQNPSSARTTKQMPARIHHFFTFNGYDSKDISILKKMFDETCYMYVFQEETGESGNKHLQGVISCKKPTRDTAFGYKSIHWEKPRNIKDSYNYCSDPNKRTGDCWSKNFDIPDPVKKPDFNWTDEILTILETEPNRRSVIWVWSSQGCTGKSTFCEYLITTKNAVFLSKGKYSDIINIIYKTDMSDKKIVCFDLPRNNGNKISYDAIESIKNGLICNTKFETGYKRFKPPHVIIFSNAEPEYDKLSEDRWIVKNIDRD